jgi:hypothetical protein
MNRIPGASRRSGGGDSFFAASFRERQRDWKSSGGLCGRLDDVNAFNRDSSEHLISARRISAQLSIVTAKAIISTPGYTVRNFCKATSDTRLFAASISKG